MIRTCFLIFGIWVCVNDKQDGDRADRSNGVPSLIPILEPIRDDDVQGIVPNALREIEGDAMRGAILSCFLGVGRAKSHHLAPSLGLH
jgi:hypothetical protein